MQLKPEGDTRTHLSDGEKREIPNVDKDFKQLELASIPAGSTGEQSHLERLCSGSTALNIRISHNPGVHS